jgi:DNA-binding CsgD family transcriptional regulator
MDWKTSVAKDVKAISIHKTLWGKYMLWDDLLKEVLNKNKSNPSFYFSNTCLRKKPLNAADSKIKRPLKIYSLGEKYGTIYFTRREAECMVWMLKGKTINSIAEQLSLSPRTVEFYVKNMKAKLGCKTKYELVDLVYGSEFIKNVDFS